MGREHTFLFGLDTCKYVDTLSYWGRVLNDRRVKREVVEVKESEPLRWVQDQEKVQNPSILFGPNELH